MEYLSELAGEWKSLGYDVVLLDANGETVTTRDFLRIGVPFTLAAVLTGYVYLWLVWGRV